MPSKYESRCCILSKFYIKPQLPVAPGRIPISCILSKFYIKPQLRLRRPRFQRGCILSKFYIKPQHRGPHRLPDSCCILSKFYIKPQPPRHTFRSYRVVSYRNSTSNHNRRFAIVFLAALYLIEILHQTTTLLTILIRLPKLYLIEILHQTTTPKLAPLQC